MSVGPHFNKIDLHVFIIGLHILFNLDYFGLGKIVVAYCNRYRDCNKKGRLPVRRC